MEVCC